MKTVPEILRGAAQLARQGRWIQGTRFSRLLDPTYTLTGCAMGLLDVANQGVIEFNSLLAFPLSTIEASRPEAVVYLARVVAWVPPPTPGFLWPELGIYCSRQVMSWNDVPERSAEQVALAMERAAALYEADHPVSQPEDVTLPEPELVCV